MIKLHRKRQDTASDQLEQQLNNLVISFKKVNYEEEGEQIKLPYIEEDGVEFHTEEEIAGWMRDLESQLNWQRSLSGDGCFIDPKSGKIC
ncbi:MAG: hypothetical protein JJ953_02805 [Gracilimonas sp.]|uniref:hypothetical protein n=1 Tax=Gracilimonas TaxID=649462 RepID=UPI001B05BAF2|nr:hypothetical protein [Gracilimonas sp.]MBO6585015.1 hypothetical protein [Gracilimonas sp.]MBO6615714.1 hypothetical protein [Gracilimonas sp.]